MNIKLNRNIKYLCYVLQLFFLYIIQCTPNLFPKIFGVTPMLILPAVITMSLLESEVTAIFLGGFAGLLIDIAYGNYFGLFAIILSLICCLARVFLGKKARANIVTVSVIGSVSILICILCDWFFRYCLKGFAHIFVILINNYLPIYIYSLLCLPFIYILNFGIYHGLRSVED